MQPRMETVEIVEMAPMTS